MNHKLAGECAGRTHKTELLFWRSLQTSVMLKSPTEVSPGAYSPSNYESNSILAWEGATK